MGFSKKIKEALFGEPFQDAADVTPPVVDGRGAALRILKAYLQEVTFWRSGGKSSTGQELPAISFRIPERDVYDEWPDDEAEMNLPSIALLATQPGDYETTGLNTNVEEKSRDVYAPGTVLSIQNSCVETFPIEVWCKTKAERRAMKLGIETAFSPLQQMAGLRFKMSEYYDRFATFAIQSYEIIDDEQSILARRKLRFLVQLTYLQVRLVRVPQMQPQAEAVVIDSAADEEVEVAKAFPDQD